MSIWGVSGICTKRGLLATAVAVWLCTTMSWSYAENETLKRLREEVKEYSDTAKELQKIDQFHIQVALRRAVTAERPGVPYRWSNLHTDHKGEIVLLDFIGPRGNGRLCVDFKHTYYLGGASPIEDEGTVCQNSEGEWDDIIVRAVFEGTGASEQTAAIPRYNPSVVREIQTLLLRLNYNPGPVDGLYGKRTKRAIEFYQHDEGLSVTGKVSEELAASLNRSVKTLESLPSTVETAAVSDGSTEPPPSPEPGGPEGLAMDQNPGSTTPQETDNESNYATEITPVDRVPHPSVLTSSHKNENSNLGSQHEPSRDRAGVSAPAQTTKTAEHPKLVPMDANSAAINSKNNSPKVSNPEDDEVTASKEKPPLSATDNVQSPIAQAPIKSKTKDQTELPGSTDLPGSPVTQVSEGQGAVGRTQIGERGSIKNKDKTPAGEDAGEFKSPDTTVEPYDSNWIMVFIGLMFSAVAGVIASRYLSSGINRSATHRAEMEQVAAELDNKIAIVVGQVDKDLDKAPMLDRNAASRGYRHPTEVARNTPFLNEPVEVGSENEQGVSFPGAKRLASKGVSIQEVEPTQQQMGESGSQGVVVESNTHPGESKQREEVISETATPDENRPLKDTTEEMTECLDDAPTQQQDKEDFAVESQDIIIQAITEFDELIEDTEEVLAMDLELDSRENITKAIEQATKMIKKAFEKDPVEGGSHKYTRKAIRKATKLIKEALEEYSIEETSRLRIKNR